MPALTSILLASAAVGAATSGAASIASGIQAKKQSKREAFGILTRARQESAIVGENAAREASAKRAAAGASGLAGEGSVLSQLGTLFDASLQQRNINTSAAINAQSVLKQGKNAQTAGILGGIGSIIGSFGQIGLLGLDAGAFGGAASSPTGTAGKFSPDFKAGGLTGRSPGILDYKAGSLFGRGGSGKFMVGL